MRKFLLYLSLCMLSFFSAFLILVQPSFPSKESIAPAIHETDPAEPILPLFSVVLSYRGITCRINSWEDESGSHYLFLPKYLSIGEKNNKPEVYSHQAIVIDGKKLSAGDSFPLPKSETVFSSENKVSSLRILYSSGLPVLWLETGSGELEKIDASKEYVASISVSLLNPSDPEGFINGENASLHARGNVSFNEAPKKSYLLETEQETDLLGMGSAKKWVLISNYFDQTSLRNYLTLQLAQGLGLAFTPDARFADVYVNGDYRGMYLITEKVEVGPERVDIFDLEPENIASNGETLLKKYPYRSDRKMGFRAKSPADITGGYLVEFELDERWADEESGFVTDEGQHAVIQSPKHATIAEVNYIQNLFQRLEDSLLNTDVSDTQYQEYIDMDSFVKKYLVEEFSKNIDANKTSQYFYKYPDRISSKIYAGPSWDYDKGWGNGGKLDTDLDLRDPTQLYASRHIYPHSIWAQLYDKESFQDEVRSCFSSQALPLMETILSESLPQWKDMIYDSSRMDWIRWNGEREADTDNVEQKYVASFDLAYEELVEFARLRTEFLAAEWMD